MAKKIEEPEVKKECPSCGLGVALNSKICEFCGWDFEEEDEWILQIEKLERELMLEKQKFEPGSVDQKIEATLHTPEPTRQEPSEAVEQKPVPVDKEPPVERPVHRVAAAPTQAAPLAPSTRPAQPSKTDVVTETVEIEKAKVRAVRGAPEKPPERAPLPVRRARTEAPSLEPPERTQAQTAEGSKKKKVRVVRKVKQ